MQEIAEHEANLVLPINAFIITKCISWSMSLILLLPAAAQTDRLLQGPGQGGAPGLGQGQGQQSTQQPRPSKHRHGQPGQTREGGQ